MTIRAPSERSYYDGWREAWFLRFDGTYIDGNGNPRHRCTYIFGQ